MQGRLLRNLSFTGLQLVINQAFGLLLFLVLAEGLSKEQFGALNWSLSVLLLLFTVLSFGLEGVVVRRVAGGASPSGTLFLYGAHVLLTGLLFYGALGLFSWLTPQFSAEHSLLLLLGLGKLLFFSSTPFKGIAAGLEDFRTLFRMSITATAVKAIGIGTLYATGNLTINRVALLFIAGDGAELLVCFLLGRKYGFSLPRRNVFKTEYTALLREALHPFGTTLFAAAQARLDWICIGLFLSATHLANYSFAYKAFELATLPLLAIAPLLVPLFTRQGTKGSGGLPTDLSFLLKMELMVAALIGLLLTVGWVPLVEAFTSGQYGAVNSTTILILSLALPVLYLNNFLWSLHFARGRTQAIFYIFAASFVLNIVLLLWLIPAWGNEGAAMAFGITILVQTVLYLAMAEKSLQLAWQPLLYCCACAGAGGILAKSFAPTGWIALPLSGLLYLAFLILTFQLRQEDWQRLKQWAGKAPEKPHTHPWPLKGSMSVESQVIGH